MFLSGLSDTARLAEPRQIRGLASPSKNIDHWNPYHIGPGCRDSVPKPTPAPTAAKNPCSIECSLVRLNLLGEDALARRSISPVAK